MRWFFRQLAFNVLKMLAIFAGIYFLTIWGWNGLKARYNARADDPAYAVAFFEELVPIRSVLASRGYHPIGPDWPGWDCTYSVVELHDGAPDLPPTRRLDPDGMTTNLRYRFGGDWKETPEPELDDNTRMALSFCSQYFDDATNARLSRALAEPGSWYQRGSVVDEILYIYSLPQNIAARIRFGD
ncbi:hypothetical protein [Thalassovita mangrovi]|uniref:Uncharacterized protein n=1 Tax=Thalassovita mangrovi TaxID=2692236 RepID=A0A6L8LJL0_9RHOB|nr:hypothetical protein [Thalassovita mangrovi]MYM54680.1 hypothetical protein [Thalassovita mangrovi]